MEQQNKKQSPPYSKKIRKAKNGIKKKHIKKNNPKTMPF